MRGHGESVESDGIAANRNSRHALGDTRRSKCVASTRLEKGQRG